MPHREAGLDIGEAIGIVRAARGAGLPAAISFTVETDGDGDPGYSPGRMTG